MSDVHEAADDFINKCKAMVQTVDEVSGLLSVEFACDGKPVLATDFAKVLKHTALLLEELGKGDAEPIKWAIVEANVIGDMASFTLKGYGKEVFKAKAIRRALEQPAPVEGEK